jgi:hypothetical protein
MPLPLIRLQPQKHRRALGGHPWIYSNEIVMDDAAKKLPRGLLIDTFVTKVSQDTWIYLPWDMEVQVAQPIAAQRRDGQKS